MNLIEENLICPICVRPLLRREKQYACAAGHSFDIARQGYVNLLPVTGKHSKNPGDTKDMVAARRAFLEKGYYLPIAETVSALLSGNLPNAPAILDSGCGEGYYLSCLRKAFPEASFAGVDISRDAVRMAAGKYKEALWITASAAHLPLQDASLDCIIGMFAYTMPEEYRRVLKPGGFFLEVTAGRAHLLALKKLVYGTLTEKAEKTDAVPEGFRLVQRKTIEFPIQLHNNEDILRLLTMTPHYWRITKEGAARARAADSLYDGAQVEFRLYQTLADRDLS